MDKMVLTVKTGSTARMVLTARMVRTVRMEMLAQLVHKENKVPMV